jgi:predicted GTPase
MKIHHTPQNRQELLNVFANISKDFSSVKNQIEAQEKRIHFELHKFSKTASINPLKDNTLPEKHLFREFAEAQVVSIQKSIISWINGIDQYEKNTVFQKKFGDSLLLFVYGNVKAGKSSLGNFLAYGKHQPSDDMVSIAMPKPSFFWESGTGKTEDMNQQLMIKTQRFGVAAVEATSSIQGFTLDGLTWVDSPGLGSLNGDNGELAKNYVDSADMIVFLTNSGQPGRSSELKELAKLLDDGKRVLIIITASDEYFADEDESGNYVRLLQMKSKKDQADQKNYLSQELQKLQNSKNLLKSEVIPLSVLYAEQAGVDEFKRWDDSGMRELSANIAEIVDSQALVLKRNAPLQNLKTFCNDYKMRLHGLRDDNLNPLKNALLKATETLARKKLSAKNEVSQALTQLIEQLANESANTMDNNKFISECKRNSDEVIEQALSKLINEMGDTFDTIASKVSAISLLNSDLPEFAKKFKQTVYETSKNQNLGSAIGGLLGGGLGLLGGPLGVAGGSLVGGYIGNKIGGSVGSQSSTIDVEVGDNRGEVAVKAKGAFIPTAHLRIDSICTALDNSCFKPIATWLEQLTLELSTLESNLLNEQSIIEQSLSKD